MSNKPRGRMSTEAGSRVRVLRVSRQMTQAQVAGSQYTKAYISMLESGKTRMSMKALEHIAKRLKTTPAYIIGGSEIPVAQLLRTATTTELLTELATRSPVR